MCVDKHQAKSLPRWLLGGGISAILIILLVLISVNVAKNSVASSIDCTAFGIRADDPLAQVPSIIERGSLFSDEINEVSGVQLAREFDSGGVSGGYHLFTRGIDPTRPVGLLVRLHGDGAAEYDTPGGLGACLAAVAQSHNMITVVPNSPDMRTRTWWKDMDTNLRWLEQLVDEVSRKHTVAANSTWWMGYSGGAELISYGLLPAQPNLVTAGAIMVGGGGAPYTDDSVADAHLRSTVNLRWVAGLRDDGSDPKEPFDAISAAREGSSWYRSRGFGNVETDFTHPYDHFTYPQALILQDVLDQ